MTRISRPAAAVLCAGGLAVAVPEVAMATPAALATSRAAEPATPCLSGVRRVRAECRHTPSRTLYVVQKAWIPFTTLRTTPCATSGSAHPGD